MNISEINVNEFTTPMVVTIGPEDSLDVALEYMQNNQIRHLPVTENGDVVGIVSERDVLVNIGKSWSRLVKIGDIMNTDLLTVSETDNLSDVAYQLASQKKGSAIVVDQSGNLSGIFTTTDALNALVEILNPLARGKSDL